MITIKQDRLIAGYVQLYHKYADKTTGLACSKPVKFLLAGLKTGLYSKTYLLQALCPVK